MTDRLLARPLRTRTPADTLGGGRDAFASPHASDGTACGIVLAGSYYWGGGVFEQLLRGPLLPVAQRPVICFPLAWLRSGGVLGATVCANSSTPMVRRTLGDGAALGLALSYLEEDQPRGPAGCARDAALATAGDTFVLVEGAMIPSLDLRELLAAHRRAGAAVTVVVEVDRRRSAVGGARRPAPGGIYVVERHVLNAVPATGFHDIKQGLLERIYAAGEPIHVHEVQGVSPRILNFDTYASASGWLISTAARRPEFRDYVQVGEILRHRTAVVDPTACAIGPALVGPHARVGANAVLVGPVSIGAHSVVEATALIARSSVWERCYVGRGAVIDAALLAHGVVAAAGARVMGTVEVVDGNGRVADVLAPTYDAWAEPVRLPQDFSLLHASKRADAVAR